jgi:hypothetical protein
MIDEREGLDAYLTYIAIKMHFNSDYDYVKYNGKTRINLNSFLKRNDKFFFRKLAKKYTKEELVEFFVASFVSDSKTWIRNMTSDSTESAYGEWKKTQESLSYLFEEDIRELQEKYTDFNSLFDLKDGHPPVLKLLLQKKIRLETAVILDSLVGFTSVIDKKLSDIIWKEHSQLIKKYRSFLKIDRDKYMRVVKKYFT